jgi:hypothetical protein
MIITIKNDSGETVYDVSKIENSDSRMNANVSINKMGTLNTLVEALNFATQGHQGNLELIVQKLWWKHQQKKKLQQKMIL